MRNSPDIVRQSDGSYLLEFEQLIPRNLEDTFAFFSRPENLERIIPSFLRFHLTTPTPIEMKRGAIIQYKLRVLGIKVNWRTLIAEWDPMKRFIDVQQKGPYKLWRHEHLFEQTPDGTLVKDRVTYRIPFGPIGHMAQWLFVRRQLTAIWHYRAKTIANLLSSDGAES